MRTVSLRRISLRSWVLIALSLIALISMAQNIPPVKDRVDDLVIVPRITPRLATMESWTVSEEISPSYDNSQRLSNDDPSSNTRLLMMPSLFDFLPHLRNQSRALRPSISYPDSSIREGVKFAIGIPTVPRQKASYVLETVQSLIFGMSSDEQLRTVVILMIADGSNLDAVHSQISSINASFSEYIDSGLLHIIVTPKEWYPPDLNTTEPNHGDTQERMYWRTKQNLDYMFLMLFSRPLAEFYLQLEDDVLAKPGYLAAIEEAIDLKKGSGWLSMDFSSLGFIGKLFRTADLHHLIQFIAILYRYRPVDWILDTLFYDRYCKPFDKPKECLKEFKRYRLKGKTLFQHVGVQSSLNGKVQKLKEKNFGDTMSFNAHRDNPPANLSVSLPHYKDFSFVMLYEGASAFWSSQPPNHGDYFHIRFLIPTAINGILVRTGNAEHPSDTLVEGARLRWKLANATLFESGIAFDSHGMARTSFAEPAVISDIRIEIYKEYQNWIVISELHVKL